MFYTTAYFSVLYNCLLQCSIPLLTSVFYTTAYFKAKTCASIENVYGLEQCINGHYNLENTPLNLCIFLRRRDETQRYANLDFCNFCPKKRPGLEPEGSDQSPSIIPKRLRARVNWHDFNTVNEADKGILCKHRLCI